MNDLVEWLVRLERKAGDFYRDAAVHFAGSDDLLSGFLLHLAEDEAWHLEIMENAAAIIRKSEETVRPAIILDEAAKARIDNRISNISQKLSDGDITTGDMLEFLAAAEFSEWNDVFLYVINLLKNENLEYQTIASKIQAHITHIETFIRSMPEGDKYIDVIKNLPRVWTPNILVVDNEPSISRFLSMLLEKEGSVHVAENGKAALDKMNRYYFDVILTDLNMPVMDGISLYKRAVEKMPAAGSKFIFFSGAHDQKQLDFFEANRLRYLLKPAPITEILKNVQEILDSASAG